MHRGSYFKLGGARSRKLVVVRECFSRFHMRLVLRMVCLIVNSWERCFRSQYYWSGSCSLSAFVVESLFSPHSSISFASGLASHSGSRS